MNNDFEIYENLIALHKERVEALINFDLEYARKYMPGLSEEVLILGMHKARYLCNDVPAEQRHASAKFLRDGGHDSNGKAILPEGYLPK